MNKKGKMRLFGSAVSALFLWNSWTALAETPTPTPSGSARPQSPIQRIGLAGVTPSNPPTVEAARARLRKEYVDAFKATDYASLRDSLSRAAVIERTLQDRGVTPVFRPEDQTRLVSDVFAQGVLDSGVTPQQQAGILTHIQQHSPNGLATTALQGCNPSGSDPTGFLARLTNRTGTTVRGHASPNLSVNANQRTQVCNDIKNTAVTEGRALTFAVNQPQVAQATPSPTPSASPTNSPNADDLNADQRAQIQDLLKRIQDARERGEDARDLEDALRRAQAGNQGEGESSGEGSGSGGESSGGQSGGESSGGGESAGQGSGKRDAKLGKLLDNLKNKRDRDRNKRGASSGRDGRDSQNQNNKKNARKGSGKGKNLFSLSDKKSSKKNDKKQPDSLKSTPKNFPADNKNPVVNNQPPPQIPRVPINKVLPTAAALAGALAGGFGGAAAAALGGLQNFGNPANGGGGGGAIGAFPVVTGQPGGGQFAAAGGSYTVPNINAGTGQGFSGGSGGEAPDDGTFQGDGVNPDGSPQIAQAGVGSGPTAYNGNYLGAIISRLGGAWILNAITRQLSGGNLCSIDRAPDICLHPNVKELEGLRLRGIEPGDGELPI